MSCDTKCKNVQGPVQYTDSLGQPSPFYIEPDTGKKVMSGNSCAMELKLPCCYYNTDIEKCYVSKGTSCPDWCAVSNAILDIAKNTYQVGGSTAPTPTPTTPLGYATEALAISAGLTSGDFYFNSTLGEVVVIC
jgi:hypothetical protein